MPEGVQLLIITGSMGSGKSSVLGEASDILVLSHLPHAAIDLDSLSIAPFPYGAEGDAMIWRNLRSIWRNYASAGITRLLLAGALEDREQLERCRAAVAATELTVCRLTAGLATMEQRIRGRESGIFQQKYVDRVRVLNDLIDRAQLEDFSVINESRPINQVATEMLTRAGWLGK